ncbi:putative ATPase/DNA-binding winged helix-turn-helix (wHTH) protein [Rhizobium sp. BK196]|uniref:ATP-binding protein n=1 Tax=Rhizobium sp. BK196 TaxID=2587073 RepID=UPI00180886B3|nr:winged helix-turn-helix domain-containing protein [Rhizobium sp. BK196]MBB3308529.1 putative ATPase/DNA-binding winged helix-turn-helix (wHTH) protein [Rhizobium sp. BK196]
MEQADMIDATTYCFGNCRFTPARQSLLCGDIPIRLGSRAMDLLHALVRQPGQVVNKSELLKAAWPNLFVDESNLKVNIAALRRALQTNGIDIPCIATVPGRGYRFVASLTVVRPREAAFPASIREIDGALPPSKPLVGRADALAAIVEALQQTRLLTVVGPAGVGKTSIAVAAARAIANDEGQAVCFVDLAAIEKGQFVALAVSRALGIVSNPVDDVKGLVDALRGRNQLLVLDNCEHVLAAVAGMADQLNHALHGLNIIATSREPLRCRFETVHRLAPLQYPPADAILDTGSAMAFSAIELLVRRAETHGYRLEDADVPSITSLSRRLDGIALAIELAAPQLPANGPAGLLQMLERDFDALSSRGDGMDRHKTLTATLNWSYRLLSENEAWLLRHLSVFGGTFALDDVIDAFGHLAHEEDLAAWLEALATKSMMSVNYTGRRRRYRLLDSTRTFANKRLIGQGEQQAAMIAYGRFILALFERAEEEWTWRPREDWVALYGGWSADLRRMIDWAYGSDGQAELGVRLTVAALPFWVEFSTMAESGSRVEKALSALDTLSGDHLVLRMKLVAAHGWNLCYRYPFGDELEATWKKGFELALEAGSVEHCLRTKIGLANVQSAMGFHQRALETIADLRRFMASVDDYSAAPNADRQFYTCEVYQGRIESGHAGLERLAREHAVFGNRGQTSRFQIDRFVNFRNHLSLAAWVVGRHQHALDIAEEALNAALTLDHDLSCAHSLALAATPVALLCGRVDLAQERATMLVERLKSRQIDTWPPFARFHQAAIDAARGDAGAVQRMKNAIGVIRECNFLVHLPLRYVMLAHAALSHDQVAVARESVEEGVDYCRQRGDRWCDAEFLHLRGLIFGRDGDVEEAARHFQEAIDLGRKSGALGFALHAATSRVRLARQIGSPVALPLAELKAISDRCDSCGSLDIVAAHEALRSGHARIG